MKVGELVKLKPCAIGTSRFAAYGYVLQLSESSPRMTAGVLHIEGGWVRVGIHKQDAIQLSKEEQSLLKFKYAIPKQFIEANTLEGEIWE